MAIPIAAMAASAASSKGGGGGGGASKWDIGSKQVGGIVKPFMDFAKGKKVERAAKAANRQRDVVEERNRSQSNEYAAAQNALQAGMMGPSGNEFVSSDAAIIDNVDALGGEAVRTELMREQGYNPMMEFNPLLQQVGSLADAEDAMKEYAGGVADSSIAGWEASQSDLKGEYDAGMDAVAAERERRRGVFTSEVEGLEASRIEDDAEAIVREWVESESGTRRYESRGPLGVRSTGQNNTKKRDVVDDLIAQGYSYSDILNGEAGTISDDISKSPDTRAGYSSWRGDQ